MAVVVVVVGVGGSTACLLVCCLGAAAERLLCRVGEGDVCLGGDRRAVAYGS